MSVEKTMGESISFSPGKDEKIESSQKINFTQTMAGLILLGAMIVLSIYLSATSGRLPLFLMTGVGLGYIMTRTRYGFAGGIKRIYVTGEGSLTKALLLMLAVAVVIVGAMHWMQAAAGQTPAGTSSVHILNLPLIIGGFLFGIGMIFSGGCASGTLTDLGEGAGRAAITLIFFILGSIPGLFIRDYMMQGAVGQTGVELYLPDLLGYAGAIGISLLVLFGLYRLTKKYENFRKKEGYFEENVYEESEKKMPSNGENKLFSYRTYHNIFVRRWSFAAGGILLALAIAFIIRTTGHAWGVTGGFTNWGVAFFSLFGVEFTSSAFSGVVKTVENGILYDAISLRNGGMIVGAAIAFLLAGKFKFDKNFTAKDTVYYAVGGIMMGVGARMAGGCNIGALFSGIVNFSLSGWGFMVVMSLGAVVALKLFAGKANTIPPNRY